MSEPTMTELLIEWRELEQKENLDEGALDWIQTGLDVGGLIPGLGEALDAVNALISLARGNPLEAVLSVISMVPAAGDAVGKGGKAILKVFGPAIDLIKNGEKVATIIKKVGPDTVKKIAGVINTVKDFAAKNGDTIKDLFKHIKAKDLDKLEELAGFKVPSVANSKVEQALEKVASKLPEADLHSIFKFLAKIDVGDKMMGRGDDEEDIVESLRRNGMIGTLYGDAWVNQRLLETGREVQKIIES